MYTLLHHIYNIWRRLHRTLCRFSVRRSNGTAVPSFWDDANGPPPDVYNVPLTAGDLARTFERIVATTHPASYRTPAHGRRARWECSSAKDDP